MRKVPKVSEIHCQTTHPSSFSSHCKQGDNHRKFFSSNTEDAGCVAPCGCNALTERKMPVYGLNKVPSRTVKIKNKAPGITNLSKTGPLAQKEVAPYAFLAQAQAPCSGKGGRYWSERMSIWTRGLYYFEDGSSPSEGSHCTQGSSPAQAIMLGPSTGAVPRTSAGAPTPIGPLACVERAQAKEKSRTSRIPEPTQAKRFR